LWFNPTTRDGLVIADVVTTGPFARLGFLEGDRIVSVNGRRVLTEPDFMQFLMANNTNPVEVVVFRNGRNERIVVDPTILTQDNFIAEVSPLEEFGIVLDDRFNDRVVVWQVLPQSPAFYAGFRPGDVVTTLSGQPFRARSEFESAVSGMRAGQANVQVRRGTRTRDLVVDVPQFTRTAQRSAVGQRGGDRIEGRTQGIDQGGNNPRINQPQNNPGVPNVRGGAGERGEIR
jgi:S1-C subfamily serine protease